jgi:fructose-bisphosphate aldolase, class I
MTPRVKEILSWYGADSPGTLTSLARLLNHGRLAGTGKLVILPVDQGFEHGPARSFAPNPPAYNPHYYFELAIEADCNAYAAPLGFMEGGARDLRETFRSSSRPTTMMYCGRRKIRTRRRPPACRTRFA